MSLTDARQHLTVGRGLAPAANLNKLPQHQIDGAAVNYLTYWNLWNIQNTMNEPSLGSNHDDKCANGKEQHFCYGIGTRELKLLFQICGQDSGQQTIDHKSNTGSNCVCH